MLIPNAGREEERLVVRLECAQIPKAEKIKEIEREQPPWMEEGWGKKEAKNAYRASRETVAS
jgi:hypothetical protein